MQPKTSLKTIIRKETTLFFASPMAYLFLATFALATVFIFFWAEAFFARNIADVRPLFEWMPVLLIFLCSALTMRMWSEERRTGTIEHVLTSPTPAWVFVLGKFVACLLLLAVALLLTLPLPMMVAWLGNLDWGPVVAGYLATLFLGATYLAIGLCVSARSTSQIVSLIVASLLCGVLYLLGNDVLTRLFSNNMGDILRLLGSGSRFNAITRGIIDCRDFYYYLSITGAFLLLTIYILEQQRWAQSAKGQASAKPLHGVWRTVLLAGIANLFVANIWFASVHSARFDVTDGNIYSISNVTRSFIAQLQEPLLIRAYFSEKTHPLLAPLLPQLKDLLNEYQVAGNGKVRVEFIDPAQNPELEKEANEKYDIKPVPFQIADRYQASVVNSYLNVLVQYGDQFQTLGFRDLIEVKQRSEQDIDVQLRNPEYDITRAIKKVLNSYQSGGNLFSLVRQPVTLTAYISAEAKLPVALAGFNRTLQDVIDGYKAKSGDKLIVKTVEPEANNNAVAQQMEKDYGFRPMSADLFNTQTFYYYLVMSDGKQAVQVQVPDDLSEAALKRNMDSAIKRFAKGFNKTVGLVKPVMEPDGLYGQTPPDGLDQLRQYLGENYTIEDVDLQMGVVPGNIDLLLLADPKQLSEKAVFAIDQYLMQGGTVLAATSPFTMQLGREAFNALPEKSGMEDWLASYGISMENKLVMDTHNVPFPAPVIRQMGGISFQEVQMLDYPYFVDLRAGGLNAAHPATSALPQLTLAWPAPISLQTDRAKGLQFTVLANSSSESWLGDFSDIRPRMTQDGSPAYLPAGQQQSWPLAVVASGRFDSFFRDKKSPLLEKTPPAKTLEEMNKNDGPKPAAFSGIINHSAESARLIVISSGEFFKDQIMNISGAADGRRNLNALQFLNNTIDWALDDDGLLTIRARGHFNRTLPNITDDVRSRYEYASYAAVALLLAAIAGLRKLRERRQQKLYAGWV